MNREQKIDAAVRRAFGKLYGPATWPYMRMVLTSGLTASETRRIRKEFGHGAV